MMPWLDAYGQTRCVMQACHVVGMSRSAVYEARETDEAFGETWDALNQVHNELLRSSMFNKALDGWAEPVFHDGRICGYRQRFSVDLIKWVARQRLPEYRQLTDGESKSTPDEIARQVRSFLDAMLATVDAPPQEPRAVKAEVVARKTRTRKPRGTDENGLA